MRASNFNIFNSVSMASTQTSAPIWLYNIFGVSAQFVFTGSPVGTFTVEVSDDPSPVNQAGIPQPTNWTTMAGSSNAVSAAGNLTYNITDTEFNWIRFVYTASSGSGSLTGRANLKGI